MTAGEFTLELDGFRGPLGLLLDLVEQRKMNVSDVSLAGVSDDYISYIKDKEKVPLSETAQFVVIAATLLLIKSRSLLPTIELTNDEEEDIRDLHERLKLYAYVRQGTKLLRAKWTKGSFLPKHLPTQKVVFAPAKDITPHNIKATAERMIAALPVFKTPPTARIDKEIKLEDVIESLTQRMRSVFKDSFSSVTSGSNRIEAIVNFLALLELVKRGTLQAKQSGNFDEITMHNEEIETPRYG